MGRSPCCEKNGLKKGPWTQEEDQKLIDYISKHGYGNWRTLPKNAGLRRCGKSCRLRWTNYLRPDIKRGRFSSEEEETIIQLHSILGNKWSTIAARLPGRTDNEIKNYWNTHIRKKLLRMGIDPVTHTTRLDLLDLSSILNSSLYNSSQMNLLAMQHLANPYILQQSDQVLQSSQFQAPFSGDIQLMEPFVEPFSSNFSTQNCQVNELQSNDYIPLQDQYLYQGSDQLFMDQSLSETSKFQCNNNMRFQSNLSTPSSLSSPAQGNSNSNSTYVTSSSSFEDERESYCSNMLNKFEFPHIFDVNEFM